MNILAFHICLRPYLPDSFFPVGLSYVLSGVRRAGYKFEFMDVDLNRYSDAEILNKLRETKWDIILMGCIVTGYRIIKKMAAQIRETNPGALIVVGNSVASSIPEILLDKTEVDVAVIGEGDVTIVEVLDKWINEQDLRGVKGIYYKKGNLIVRNPGREVIADINTIPYQTYNIFDVEKYIQTHKITIGEPLPMERDRIRAFPVAYARGCVAHCTFCYHCFRGDRYRHRSARSVIDEIKLLQSLYGVNYIMTSDDLMFSTKQQINDFLELIAKERLDFYWTGIVRGNMFQSDADLDLLKKVKGAGCVRLGSALESADEEILKAMRKRVSLEQFRRQKMLLNKAGLTSGTSIVLGYPQETPETIGKTFQFCMDIGIYPSTGFLLPQPGTPIYEWAKKEKYIRDEEEYLLNMGDRQDLRINLTKMSEQEFVDVVTYWLRKLNKKLNLGLSDDQLIKTKFKRERKDSCNLDADTKNISSQNN